MAGFNENIQGFIRHDNPQGGLRAGGGKIGAGIAQNRRALSTINNRNVIGAPPYPSNKRGEGGLRAGGGKIGAGIAQNRRALSTINNRNVIGAPPYPSNKRGEDDLQEKHAIPCKKNPPIPVHRPITRKFAAQMASKQQHPVLEEKRPAVHTVFCVRELEDFNAPMLVQYAEAMPEEIDRMNQEIEMEDIDEQPVMDIDSKDKTNILAVADYIDEIYAHYRKTEELSCVSPNYMSQQFDINERMRAILIDWLIEVHYKFELMEETLYLTVNLIDRFLSVQTVVRKKLQLVGVTALLLACKYEEVSVPVVDDLILISDKAYTRKEVLDMEKLMLNTLQFCLSVPTPCMFMKRFLKAAQSDKEMELLAFFLIDLCLVEYEMLKFPPSMLAAAAVFTAQSTLGGSKQWSKTSEKQSQFSEFQLIECSKMMVSLHQKAAIGKLTGVHRKYSTSKYGYTAKLEPAHFILEPRI